MDTAAPQRLLDDVLNHAGHTGPVRREPVRESVLSVVERIRFADGTTAIFKYSVPPLTAEARVLAHTAKHGVPVPAVLAAAQHSGGLGILLEDLGEPAAEATVGQAAEAAAVTHRVPAPHLQILDGPGLARLPGNALRHLEALREGGRWDDDRELARQLRHLDRIAARCARDAELPPFGLCHSEFHPTSLYVTAGGWRLLDWARAFIGPGLLDLASWQNTTEAPDFDRLYGLLDSYVAAGGPAEATADRADLPVEKWACGWHRVWICEWYLAQALTWIGHDVDTDLYQQVIGRHLTEALDCLDPA